MRLEIERLEARVYLAADVVLASTALAGGNGNSVSFVSSPSSLSVDGRVAAFQSYADDLVSNDLNFASDIFVFDATTQSVRRVSESQSGEEGNLDSLFPSISGDGRYVVFDSDADNLVANDNNGQTDVFRKDLVTGEVRRVSVSSSGGEGNNTSTTGSMSHDGRYVVFYSYATNLVSGTSAVPAVFLKDMQTNAVTRIDSPLGFGAFTPTISGNGQVIVFAAATSSTGTQYQLMAYRTSTSQITLVSGTSSNTAGNGTSSNPSISGDGRFVVFDSLANNLVANDSNNTDDVFVKDLATGGIRRASTDPAGIQGDGSSRRASISSDGRYVAFDTLAANLFAGDTNSVRDVVRKDLATGEVARVSESAQGVAGDAQSNTPSISENGEVVMINSDASNLTSQPMPGGQVFRVALAAPVVSYPPSVNAFLNEITVSEGSTAFVDGAWGDTAGGNEITLTASLGTVVKSTIDGIWEWRHTPQDNAPPQTVTITATNAQGDQATTTFTLNTRNVRPEAAGIIGPEIPRLHSQAIFSIDSPFDPSSVDTQSLRFGFATTAANLPKNYQSASIKNEFRLTFASQGVQHVFARVYDKDGAVSATYHWSANVGAWHVDRDSSGAIVVEDTTSVGNDVVVEYGAGAIHLVSLNHTFTVASNVQASVLEESGGYRLRLPTDAPIILKTTSGDDRVTLRGTMIQNIGRLVSIDTGAGADNITLETGATANQVDSGDGNDNVVLAESSVIVQTLLLGAGNDLAAIFGQVRQGVFGGDGNDTIRAGATTAGFVGIPMRFHGEGGNDTITGGNGDDFLDGGSGNDQIQANNGNDLVYAGDGNDMLRGGIGNDILYGEDGNDQLIGDAGNDFMLAGNGNDSISDALGANIVIGGNGRDTILTGGTSGTLSLGDGWSLEGVARTGEIVTASMNSGGGFTPQGANQTALTAINQLMAAWASSSTFGSIVSRLAAMNATATTFGSGTIVGDNIGDVIALATSAADAFYQFTGDSISGVSSTKNRRVN